MLLHTTKYAKINESKQTQQLNQIDMLRDRTGDRQIGVGHFVKRIVVRTVETNTYALQFESDE